MSPQKRSSPILVPPAASPGSSDLRQRVIACLNKLSDRDTFAVATAELESIARSLTHDSFSPFLNCLHSTDSSSKSPVRKQCVSLLTFLSYSHGNSLSPHLSKMVSTVVRRLRDPNSAVRSACVEATTAMSSQITQPPFATVSKPLIEMLTVEQDLNPQIGAAMCLAAAIEAAPEPEVEQLRKLLPRFGKLVQVEGFKAKAALLSVIGSIVGVGGAGSKSVLDWLIPCLVDLLSSEDWASRKSAAEALGKIAVAEKQAAKNHKISCLSSLENRRFDKVKLVRETMNRALELWKEVDGGSDQGISVSSLSRSSSGGGNGNGGCIRSSTNIGYKTPSPPSSRKSFPPPNRSPPSDASPVVTTAKKQSPVKSNDSNSRPAIFQKVDHRRPSSNWKTEVAVPAQEKASEDDIKVQEPEVLKSVHEVGNGVSSPETKRVLLFSSRTHDKLHKFAGFRSGSRVAPYDYCDDEMCYTAKGAGLNKPAEDVYENPKETEDLSLIREQLVQIETQQSNLLDLLQRFMGRSQSGINSLEARVLGLEMTLDEICHDLAVSRGRIPEGNPADNTCCKLPGTEFLNSKHYSAPLRLPDGRRFQQRHSSSKGGFVGNSWEEVHIIGRGNLGGLSPGQVSSKLFQDEACSQRAGF